MGNNSFSKTKIKFSEDNDSNVNALEWDSKLRGDIFSPKNNQKKFIAGKKKNFFVFVFFFLLNK